MKLVMFLIPLVSLVSTVTGVDQAGDPALGSLFERVSQLLQLLDRGQTKRILLDSTQGQKLWSRAAQEQTLLLRIFSKQQLLGYCGIQSAALLMSARYFAEEYPDPAQWATCDVSDVPYADYTLIELPTTAKVISKENALTSGATMGQIEELLLRYGIPAKKFHTSESSLAE